MQNNGQAREKVLKEYALNLNEDQKHAIERILKQPEYCLVHGMPGSGKTSTIVQAIKVRG